MHLLVVSTLLAAALASPLERRSNFPCVSTYKNKDGKTINNVAKINAAFKDPLSACYWWRADNQGYSPFADLDGWTMTTGCACIFEDPAKAKSTFSAPKTLSSNKDLAKMQKLVQDATEFCLWWIKQGEHELTPFAQVGSEAVKIYCRRATGTRLPARNLLKNGYFQGSGQAQANSVGSNLVLPYWDYTGGRVAVGGPPQGTDYGNVLVLANGYNVSTASISQTAMYLGPTGYRFQLDMRRTLRATGGDCVYDISIQGRSVWNQTVDAPLNRNDISGKANKADPINFTSVKDDEYHPLVFTVKRPVGKGKADRLCEWYMANVTLIETGKGHA